MFKIIQYLPIAMGFLFVCFIADKIKTRETSNISEYKIIYVRNLSFLEKSKHFLR